MPTFRQNEQFWLSWPKFAQKRICGCKFINYCWNKNQHPRDISCANFQLKQTNLTLFGPNLPKKKIRIWIPKTNVGVRISILEIPCAPIFRQNRQRWIFGPKFALKWVFRSKLQKSKSWLRISILEILCAPIFREDGKLWIFGPNLPKNGIWGRNMKNLSLDSKLTPPIYHVCQFSVKTDNF